MAEVNYGPGFSYRLLSRLQQDCEYYLGAGGRHKKHLWAQDEAEQIQKMKELYAGLTEKPEWITLADIERYEAAMVCPEPIVAVGKPIGLDQMVVEKASHAGELLIRAAAVLGTLSPEQQEALRQATDGNLPDGIVLALRGVKAVSPQIAQSLRTHPPVGFVDLEGVTQPIVEVKKASALKRDPSPGM